MDKEAELIRSENWTELKRFYSGRSGHTWELAWVHLLRMRDHLKATEEFQRTYQDPRFEEASFIVLWKLGKKPGYSRAARPPSLKFYESFLQGDFAGLRTFIDKPQNAETIPYIVEHTYEHLKVEDLEYLERKTLPLVTHYYLGVQADRRLKNLQIASRHYGHFFQDPWVRRVSEEVHRVLFDAELSSRLRNAYSAKDGVTVKRILKTAQFRLEKLNDEEITFSWREALRSALESDTEQLTQNLLGFPFWKTQDLSPSSLFAMRQGLFAKEEWVEPDFVKAWANFFESERWDSLPIDMDPNSLALWQIKVEVDPGTLSQALLKFPTEERFLFLWSLRQRESQDPKSPRKLPEDFKESDVVRKNLERAFDRSTNRVLWFDRLRSVGCSQDFYEYAIQRVALPLQWILQDLQEGHLNASPVVRGFLRDQLSLVGPSESGTEKLETTDLLKALSFLTPAETQNVLLSRFVLTSIPDGVLNDDILDLLWDARSRVSREVSSRWLNEVLHFLSSHSVRQLQPRHWKWVEWAWSLDKKYLEKFSPQIDSGAEFPWENYLDCIDQHGENSLMLTVLARVPIDRLKEHWIRRLMVESSDSRLHLAIQSISEDYVRLGLLGEWAERKGEVVKAIDFYIEQMALEPVLNHQVEIARRILKLERGFRAPDREKQVQQILEISKFLESHGGLDANLFREVSGLLELLGDFGRAWRFSVQEWLRANPAQRSSLLERLSGLAFQGRLIEEMQRFLVDQLFQSSEPQAWINQSLDILLSDESAFKLKHLRPEFIEKASQFFPLHPEVIRARATFDYRAVLLWEAFYGDELLGAAAPPSVDQKRRAYELWGFTEGLSSPESWSTFARYIHHIPVESAKSESHEFLETAQRISARLSKSYGIKKSPQIFIRAQLPTPIRMSFDPLTIEIEAAFFELLDEEVWAALSVAIFQISEDRARGLFDDRKLMERFFMGMMISGAPMAKLIRLWVWLAIHEGQIDSQVLKSKPQDLVARLPFLNSLLIFFLSQSYSDKVQQMGLIPR